MPVGPLIPRPAVTFIALILTGFMGMNIWLDAGSLEYNGGQTTLVLGGLIAGILGFELFRNRGSKP